MDTKIIEKLLDQTLSSRALPVIFFITVLALPNLGFCDAGTDGSCFPSFLKTATAAWLKRIFCTGFALAGIWRAGATHTIAPLMMFGGISIFFGFIDKLINFLPT